MKWPRFRPTFSMPLPIAPEAFVDGVREQLLKPQAPVTGILVPHQVELRIPERDQRLFTPVLHILIKSEHELVARFAPHPHLWMLVIAIYFGLAFVGIGALMLALSLTFVVRGGEVPWLVWAVVPGVLALGGFIHGAVLIGQGLSADHMHILRSFLEHALEEKARAVAAAPSGS